MIKHLLPNQIRDIKGYEDLYAITDDGRVWTYPKLGKQGHFMKTSEDGMGYPFVRLQHNKTCWQPKVHRLVAEHFVANQNNKPMVNHIDGNKANNHYKNLEWVTASENIRHAFAHELSSQKGSRNACAKLDETKVLYIRERVRRGDTQKSLAEFFNVSRAVVNRIVKRKGWNHV